MRNVFHVLKDYVCKKYVNQDEFKISKTIMVPLVRYQYKTGYGSPCRISVQKCNGSPCGISIRKGYGFPHGILVQKSYDSPHRISVWKAYGFFVRYMKN